MRCSSVPLVCAQLLLITNSDYQYTHRMMSHAYDCFLPEGQTWRDLFDMVIGVSC